MTTRTHWYESYPPIGTTYQALFAAPYLIHLYPIRLLEGMDLRVVSLRARSAGGAGECSFATAIYRAVRPANTRKETMQTTPGRFDLGLVMPVGTTLVNPANPTQFNHHATVDVELDPTHVHFLAVQVGADETTTEFYAPIASGTPNVGYVSTFTGNHLGHFPKELGVKITTRAQVPYFVLRSASGARFWGDPVNG